jgi:hypothetical protein
VREKFAFLTRRLKKEYSFPSSDANGKNFGLCILLEQCKNKTDEETELLTKQWISIKTIYLAGRSILCHYQQMSCPVNL